MRAKAFDNGKLYCGRPGCPQQLGRLDGGSVYLSSHWEWDADGGLWRHAEHRRKHWPAEEPAGARAVRFGDRLEWMMAPGAVVACPRCGARQTVASA